MTTPDKHTYEQLEAQLSRLKEILKGRDEALKKIVRNWPCDNNECGRIAKQAISKTWEEGE